MNRETLIIITSLTNTLRDMHSQLETNYQQAISKGHHWPNERVNMTSAIKLRYKNVMNATQEFIANPPSTD